MAADKADEAGCEDDGADQPVVGGTLQLLRSQWELSCDTDILEICKICHLQDAEPQRPEREISIQQISASMELLCERTALDNGYLELETEAGLKSRVRENRTHGSVRGSRQAFHK